MDNNIIIKAENVSKFFKVPHEKRNTLKEGFVRLFNWTTYEKFEALNKINLGIPKGEFLGIIGPNGSGKSTLLKIIAGILQPNEGRVTVDGKISPFLELGVGFQPDLSARDNVFLYGAILGMSRKEINQKFNQIIAFAELENFVDQKLKNFSSGMQVRLAFATAIQAPSDILLVDEVLAVGDMGFQKKCYEVFDRLKEEGKTIIFVSHDLTAVERFCQKTVLLHQGRIVSIAGTEKVIKDYYRLMLEKKPRPKENKEKNEVSIKNVTFFDEEGRERNVFQSGEKIIIKILSETTREIKNVIFGVEIYNDRGDYLTGINMKMDNIYLESISGQKEVDFIMESNPFLDGTFYVTPAVADWEGDEIYDKADRIGQFEIINKKAQNFLGSIIYPHHWKY